MEVIMFPIMDMVSTTILSISIIIMITEEMTIITVTGNESLFDNLCGIV
jgi:hypothetical protein